MKVGRKELFVLILVSTCIGGIVLYTKIQPTKWVVIFSSNTHQNIKSELSLRRTVDGQTSLTETITNVTLQETLPVPKYHRDSVVNITKDRNANVVEEGVGPLLLADSSSASKDSEHPNFSGRSYVVSMFYWEQLTMASSNLMDLQCWAAQHKMVVVEPSLKPKSSCLGFSFNDMSESELFTLSDVYDMDEWHQNSLTHNMAPLASRDEFMQEISTFDKNVVLVQLKYDSVHSDDCNFDWEDVKLNGLNQFPHLKVVHRICISNKFRPLQKFDQLIFGILDPNVDTVLLISEWRGMGSSDRVNTNKLSCDKEFNNHKPLSKRLWNEAEKYANMYLGGFGRYIAMSARFEKCISNHWARSLAEKQRGIKDRTKAALKELEWIRKETGISNTFLTTDCGTFGSSTFNFRNCAKSSDLLEKFHQEVYNGTLSLHDWEDSFRTVSHTSNPGYISLLHLAIASQAKCFVRIGWGHYLDYTANTYLKNHPGDTCLKCVPPGDSCRK